MIYTFAEELVKQGNRYFIEIPFNVWEECNQKGLVPARVSIDNFTFECKLVPKGKGAYYIPVTKDVVNKINIKKEMSISFEVIEGLARINHDSPYTKEHPVRKINNIQSVTYPKAGYCGQICLAMLTGLSVDEIADVMQAKAWQCSFSRIIETLDYFGISHGNKMIYTKGKEFDMPQCCIVNVKEEPVNHVALYYKGKYYGTSDIEFDRIVSYLEIIAAC